MKVLPNFVSLDLQQHCLFCLINCGKSDNSIRTQGQEQVLQLIFSGENSGGGLGLTFRKLFWKLLIGAPVKEGPKDNNNKKVPKKVKKVLEGLDFEEWIDNHDHEKNYNDNDNDTNANDLLENEEEGEEDSSSWKKVSVCPYCSEMLVDIRSLYMELERIQMLFSEQISSLQKIIRGSHRTVKEIIKEMDNDNIDNGRTPKIPKESFEALCEFQENVISHGKKTIDVPFIILEKVPIVERFLPNSLPALSLPEAIPPAKLEPEIGPLTIKSEEYQSLVKRKRGRPPKSSFSIFESPAEIKGDEDGDFEGDHDQKPPAPLPRRRGRPPKSKSISQLDLELKYGEPEPVPESLDPELDRKDSDNDWSPCEVDDPAVESNNSKDEEYAPPTPKKKRKVGAGAGRPTRPPKFAEMLTSKRPRGRPRTNFKSVNEVGKASGSEGKKKTNYRLYIRKDERKEPVIRKNVHHRIYRCDLCGKIYFKRIALLKHQIAHKEGDVPLPVDNSSLEFDVEETKVCQICQESFLESDYNSHMLSHENLTGPSGNPEDDPDSKLHSCTHKDCIRKFQLAENLKIHMEVDHNELNSRSLLVVKKCDRCNVCYDSSKDLLEHHRKVHKDTWKDLLYCPVCSHVFTSSQNMIIHMHSHETNQQQICFKCPPLTRKSYTKRSELLLHFRNFHDLETSGTCSICGEHFEDVYWLKYHSRSIHKTKEIFVCSFCGKTCYQAGPFMNHYTKMHKKAETSGLECEFCGLKCRNKNELSRHRIKEHGAPKIPCEICAMEYISYAALKEHMRIHTDPYQCEICKKYFSKKPNLVQHMVTHSDEKPFTCEVCGARCKTDWHLKRHQLRHLKQFSCDVCGRRFARAWALKNHMKIHTGEVTPCAYCGYELHSDKSLQRHLKNYHTGDADKLKPLYPPQKRRNLRSHWKDDDGNRVYAYQNDLVKTKKPVPITLENEQEVKEGPSPIIVGGQPSQVFGDSESANSSQSGHSQQLFL